MEKNLFEQKTIKFMRFIGNEKVVHLLIENGADVNAKDDNENTPLHLAVEYGV